MVLVNIQTEATHSLCSAERSELMDAIDSLRSQGVNHIVSLPQIIVCGDQSSGKSSVLEAISGVPFPTRGNLCTRFPTELVLRRSTHTHVSVSIVRQQSHNNAEKAPLVEFHEKLEGIDGFAELIENAKAIMGISQHGQAFSKDSLRIEISGPEHPHLTIVDLPGLIHSQTRYQAASDVDLIQDMVESYMKESRSLILAVISAKNDFANQIVLKLTRRFDPNGRRTLGVITKPDTLTPGSDSETLYASLALNQEVKFRLGWHVLRNLDSETNKGTLAERDAIEAGFFCQGIWKELPLSILGADKLRHRLSRVLMGHITSEVPNLLEEIESKRQLAEKKLKKLGQPRASIHEQTLYLLNLSQDYQKIVGEAISGHCTIAIFDAVESKHGYQKRLRAVLRNLNDEFAAKMLSDGHQYSIVAQPPSPFALTQQTTINPNWITREQYIDRVVSKAARSRGQELPGLFNPGIVAELFHEQMAPWESIVFKHVKKLWESSKTFVKLVIECMTDEQTSSALMRGVFDPAMNSILLAMETRTRDILGSHLRIHPITCDQSFCNTLQSIRDKRRETEYASVIQRFFNTPELTRSHYTSSSQVDLASLVDALVANTSRDDMNLVAASTTTDYLEAYYQVARRRFIDDIAVEVVEVILVNSLGDILSPSGVFAMEDSLVASVAGESEEVRDKRHFLANRLKALTNGADTCKRFNDALLERIVPASQSSKSPEGRNDTQSSSGSPTTTKMEPSAAWDSDADPRIDSLSLEPGTLDETSGSLIDPGVAQNSEEEEIVRGNRKGKKKSKKLQKMALC